MLSTVKRTGWSGLDPIQSQWKKLVATLTVLAVIVLRFCWPKMRKKVVQPPVDYKDGIVYIHMFPRCFTKKVVNLSPFAIKLETWCRMKKVPYQAVETTKFSPKEGQIPWIRYNGEVMADSSVIKEFLAQTFGRTDDLNTSQQGIERSASRMLDDGFAQLVFFYRYHLKEKDFGKCFRITTAPRLLQSFIAGQIGKGIAKRAHMNGYSRYGEEHVFSIGKKDLKALENILDDKQFMLGDTPTSLDATVFAHLSQVLYPDLDYPWKEYIHTECPRLLDLCSRIRDLYWPDWDSLVDNDIFQ